MRARLQTGWLLAAIFAVAGSAVAQTSTPAASDTRNPPAQNAPAGSAAPPATPADPFAFPEEDSKKNNMGEEPAAPAPAAPTPNAPEPKADAHPYPGDPAAAGGGFSSSSDNAADAPDAGTLPADTRQKLDLKDEGSAGHIDTARADKDEQVADFYEKDGNYQGAYLRYKDAVTYDPDDAYGHFRLAEAARRLGKTTEAIEEYKATIKIDPPSKEAKQAEKALAEMQPSARK